MMENLNIFEELASAIIGFIVDIPLERGNSLVKGIIARKILEKKIRKRQEYLKNKYENKFESLNKMEMDSFYEWLREKGTIKRIMSFSNADDLCNISTEQIRYSKEHFFADSFKMAQVHDLYEKEELRKMLNDLFQYIDELFWMNMNELDVFIYKKCVSEIKQSIKESTEEIIWKIQYHDSFAEYIDNQKVLLEVPFKLDYRSQKIPFVGRENELKEIEEFCASERQISWWAIIGKGGSGKSRLAYQYIKNNIDSLDWKMFFLPEEFFYQVNGGGKYKNWNIWTYDKNLLLVVDYVQKYTKEVAQWIEGLLINNSITRKIRILLLDRTKNWVREGFNKKDIETIKYDKTFLEISSLKEEMNEFADKYTKMNGSTITEEEIIDVREKLKAIDSDERILYFIMILEAILKKEPWRNWNRINLVDYIVKKEQEDIAIRFKNNVNMIQSFNKLLAFCTATKELPVFEWSQDLPELIKSEIEKISNIICDKHELSVVMQLEDGILQPITPDIIGEYMVLHIIERYFLHKEEKEVFIYNLWTYDSDNFIFFVNRLFEDNMDVEPYKSIIKLMLFDAIPHDNNYVMKNYSKLMASLVAISDLNQAQIFIKSLDKIYCNYTLDETIASSYATGLYNLSFSQGLFEKKKTLETLGQLASRYNDISGIQEIFAMGLLKLSEAQNLSEKKETLRQLEHLTERYANNSKIQVIYAEGLLDLSLLQKLPDIKETIGKLEKLTSMFIDNAEIQEIYSIGLHNLSHFQKLPEIKETEEKLENLTRKYMDNTKIQETYSIVLHNLSLFQELPERKKTIGKLEYLYERNVDNTAIQVGYARGLVNLSYIQELPEIRETILKLEQLAREYADNAEIQLEFAMGLVNLSRNQELEERKKTIEELDQLVGENPNNISIKAVYAKGLYNLSTVQKLDDRRQTLERLECMAKEYINNEEIQIEYSAGLVELSCGPELSIIKEAVGKLEYLSRKYTNIVEIQINYAKGLVNLSYHHKMLHVKKKAIWELNCLYNEHVDNVEIQEAYARGLWHLCMHQELPEIKVTIEKMKNLDQKHDDNIKIQECYARGLYILATKQVTTELIRSVEKLEYLFSKYNNNTVIQTAYAYGLSKLSDDQELPEILETIKKLECLSREYVDNTDIQKAYAIGLWNLSLDQKIPEIKETARKLKHLARENTSNIVIQEIYTDVYARSIGKK